MTEIFRTAIQLARPSGPDDPGRVENGHYTVNGQTVTLTNQDGIPLLRLGSGPSARSTTAAATSRWERTMRQGETPQRVASQLLWAKWQASKRGSDFSRPIRYQNMGIA